MFYNDVLVQRVFPLFWNYCHLVIVTITHPVPVGTAGILGDHLVSVCSLTVRDSLILVSDIRQIQG